MSLEQTKLINSLIGQRNALTKKLEASEARFHEHLTGIAHVNVDKEDELKKRIAQLEQRERGLLRAGVTVLHFLRCLDDSLAGAAQMPNRKTVGELITVMQALTPQAQGGEVKE